MSKLKVLIVIIFLIVLFLILKNNKKNIENFTSYLKELDSSSIIITFYYSDNCSISRDFLYGCCINPDKINTNIDNFILKKNDDMDKNFQDDFGKFLNYKYEKYDDTVEINKTELFNENQSCIPVNNFREKGTFNNKCIINKKPTFIFFKNMIKKINLEIQKLFENTDIISVTDSLNNVFQSEVIDLIKSYKLKLRVIEYEDTKQIGTINANIPYFDSNGRINRELSKYYGNINNLNELMEFINNIFSVKIKNESDNKNILLFSDRNLKKLNIGNQNIENLKLNEDFIANIYKQNKPHEYIKLEYPYNKYQSEVVVFDFDKNERLEDFKSRTGNEYLSIRPKILWRNINNFPDTKGDYLAIVIKSNQKEYYEGFNGPEKELIYWIMWNIPKNDSNIYEQQYNKVINSDNKLDEFKIRTYSEIYPYQIFDNKKIQYLNNLPNEDLNIYNLVLENKIDIYSYSIEEAKELDNIYYEKIEHNLQKFYSDFFNKINDYKIVNIKNTNEFNIAYQYEDKLGNLTKYKKNKFKNSILSTFSFNKRLYKVENKKEIRLEKNTYWILNFYIDSEIEIYINNDLVLLDNKNKEYRIPYKTHNINIQFLNKEEKNIILELKESKYPTYRLLWKDIFISENTENNNNKLKFLNFKDIKKKSIINFKNSLGLKNSNFKFKLNFRYENLDKKMLINNKETNNLNNICNETYENNEGNLSFYFIINQKTVLYNGSVSLIEDEILEEDKLILEDSNSERVSNIKLNNLGCDYNAKYTLHSLPTLQIKLKDENHIDYNKLKLAVKVYEVKNNLNRILYLDWNIDYTKDEFINFELFRNNKTNNSISNEFNKFQTDKSNYYYNSKVNDLCEEKVIFNQSENIIFENLPKLLIDKAFENLPKLLIDKVINFYKVDFDENKYEYVIPNKYSLELIFNKVIEKWQLWKKQGNLYFWIGQQLESDYLFIEKTNWVFSIDYKDTNELNMINLDLLPSWHDKNKSINFNDVFIKEILIRTNNGNKNIFDCNIKNNFINGEPSISDIELGPSDIDLGPSDSESNDKVLFFNTIFNFGNLEDNEKIVIKTENEETFLIKNLKVEVIPYYENIEKEETINEKNKFTFNPFQEELNNNYNSILSDLIKNRYLNHNLINILKQKLIDRIQDREKIFNLITDNLLIYRGNLDILSEYFTELEVVKLKFLFYNLDEHEEMNIEFKNKYEKIIDIQQDIINFKPNFPIIEQYKRQPVIYYPNYYLDENINFNRNTEGDPQKIMNNIVKLFENYINPRKLLLKNYTSYGDISIYQNETLLKYYLPVVDKINKLCPFFKNYIYTANKEQKDRLSYQTNIIQILNLTKEIQRIRNLKDTENTFNFDDNFEKFITEKFKDQLDHNKISILNSYLKQIEIEKENKDIVKDFFAVQTDIIDSVSPNPTDEGLRIKFLKESFFYNYITLKIKNLLLDDLSNKNTISDSDNTKKKIIKELYSKIKFIYSEVLNIYSKYFEIDSSMLNKNKTIDLDNDSIPPAFYESPPKNYTQTIEDTIDQYKTMLFQIF